MGTSRRNLEESVDSNKKMLEMVEESTRPERFLDEDHEKAWELEDCQKKLIIRVTREDFIHEVKDYDPQVSDDFIFKNPVTYGARVSGIKIKIFNATGIMPHKLDIVRISISTVKAKLAWVTFTSARTVKDIFTLAVQNGNQTGFNAFPHIPSKAMARKSGIEEIMKRLQGINKKIRYQIRLGKSDLDLYMKNHEDHHYKPFRKVDLKVIDPNGEIPEWDLSVSSRRGPTPASNPFDITKNPGKRGAVESPETRTSKRGRIDDWQICEFIWAFLEGTKTEPNYKNLTWENEAQQMEGENEEPTPENPSPSDANETAVTENDED